MLTASDDEIVVQLYFYFKYIDEKTYWGMNVPED